MERNYVRLLFRCFGVVAILPDNDRCLNVDLVFGYVCVPLLTDIDDLVFDLSAGNQRFRSCLLQRFPLMSGLPTAFLSAPLPSVVFVGLPLSGLLIAARRQR